VVSATPDASRLMLEVEVAPAVELSRLRHAFVIPGTRQAGMP
jgi:cell shape-determining protein MreC